MNIFVINAIDGLTDDALTNRSTIKPPKNGQTMFQKNLRKHQIYVYILENDHIFYQRPINRQYNQDQKAKLWTRILQIFRVGQLRPNSRAADPLHFPRIRIHLLLLNFMNIL